MKREAKDAAIEALEADDALDALAGVQRVRPDIYTRSLSEAVAAPLGNLIANALGIKGAAARAMLAGVAGTGARALIDKGLAQMGVMPSDEVAVCRASKAPLGLEGIEAHACSGPASARLGAALGRIK